MNFDRIMVFDQGELKEFDKPSQLIKKKNKNSVDEEEPKNEDEEKNLNENNYITRDEYINRLMTTENGKAQIINFNINYVDDRFAKTLTKIYSKMLFDYAKESDNRAQFPINIVLEEAHRYVQNDNDVNLLDYNIFERITKEGRKYGVMLG